MLKIGEQDLNIFVEVRSNDTSPNKNDQVTTVSKPILENFAMSAPVSPQLQLEEKKPLTKRSSLSDLFRKKSTSEMINYEGQYLYGMLKNFVNNGNNVDFHKIENDPNKNDICLIGTKSIVNDTELSKDQKAQAINYLFMIYYSDPKSKEMFTNLAKDNIGIQFANLIK